MNSDDVWVTHVSVSVGVTKPMYCVAIKITFKEKYPVLKKETTIN